MAGVDPCPGVHSVQDHNRGKNWVQIEVQVSFRVIDGEGARTHEVTGKIQKTVEQWYRDK